MYHEYPYTTYYNDIDRLCKCCKALQIHLDTHGDYLRLINDKDGSVISAVKVSYADTALTDVDGNPIKTYLISAGTNGTHLVFTKGNNEVISFEVPFAQTAAKDVQDKDILDYVYGVSISGNKVRITNGDGTVYELTVPFATAAAETVDGYDLTMLACALVTDGNELVLKDTKGNELSRITPNFAVKAQKDVDGDDIKSTYANSMTQTATTLKLLAKDGTVLDEETINYATTSLKDTDGNLFLSDYAEKIVVDGDSKRIGVEAHDGTRLATITVPFATLATDATNAVENVQVIGDQIVLTTYGGQTFAITAPYAIKAQKDDLNNTIKNTYFAGVDNDTNAGTISFYDATGTLLATISNGVITHAIYDDYDNPLAGYIKTLAATAGSDYLTATHGDGTVDSITVDYSNRAWKDTNGNVIKNSYVKRLAIAQDPDDGQWKLFAFNGDNPEALLFALVIVAEKAYKDVNGKLITSYLASFEQTGNQVEFFDGEDNSAGTIQVGSNYTLDYSQLTRQLTLKEDGTAVSTIDIGFAVPATRRMKPILVESFLPPSYTPNVEWTIGDGSTFTLADGNYVFFYGGTDGKPIKLNAHFDSVRGELAIKPTAFSHAQHHDGYAVNAVEFMPRGDNLTLTSSFSGAGTDLYANRNAGFEYSNAGNKLRRVLLTDPTNVSYSIYQYNGDFYMIVEVTLVLASTDTITMPTAVDETLGIRVDTKTVAIGLGSVNDIPTLPAELQALL